MKLILTGTKLKKVYSVKTKERYWAYENVYNFLKFETSVLQKDKYVIYALINPLDNIIFYIGSTKNIKKRYENHLKCCENKEKTYEIKKIIDNNILPNVVILEGFENEKTARLVERAYIKFYKKINKNLTNIK